MQFSETTYHRGAGRADVRTQAPVQVCVGATAPYFRILGLLQVQGREQVLVTARRQQVVLAVLLLNGNRMVRLESLREALWGSAPPATARTQVQTCISALRRSLAGAGLGERIRAQGVGYAIDVAPDELDLYVFEDLVARGRAVLAANRPDAARVAFREALALWRGEPLAGIDSTVVGASRIRIVERRVEVIEDCIDAELRLGRHREVVAELLAMVAEHPLRERFVGLLMTALYGCGRRVEALAAYRTLRQTFVDELGIEPSPAIRQLHQDILTESMAGYPDIGRGAPVAVRAGAAVPAPRMLPARVLYFTGHADLLSALRRQLVDDQGPGAALMAVLAGRAGVGKSTVAIEAAHELAAAFPDGQLYARLTDGTGNTADVLERFLRALGFAGSEIPADLEGRAALYRSAIAGRRLLTVIEDVTDEAQVRVLVPITPGCRLIVTTRARTAALPGTSVFELDVLDSESGIELLAAMVGRDRVCAEIRAANELIELCGGLQLAVVGAATQLAARPHWTFEHLVVRLRGDHRRLDQLGDLGIDVRAGLRRGLLGVNPVARRLFARLGLLETDGFAAWVAAPLLDLDAESAADALEVLVDARLVDVLSGTAVRYRLHELAWIYAREQLLAQEPAEEQTAALHRVFGAWLCLADEARLRHGGNRVGGCGEARRWPLAEPVLDALLADPSAWYELERSALLATVRQAARVDAVDHCWNLAVAVADLAGARHRFADWRSSSECALRAVLRAGDRLGEATIQYLLGELDLREHRYSEAASRINLALAMFEQLDEAGWHELVQRSLAVVDQTWANMPRQRGGYLSSSDGQPRADQGAGLHRRKLRPHQFELASRTDIAGYTDSVAQGRSRGDQRQRPRPRPRLISSQSESDDPEDR